ncbi:SDR family oxidoreductase [Hansschlegelia sp. KR7-227]|uniref:SDR family oxidoreductase n=1 Tax=Hansschlegelia sp. KR7-227 TaxID=3400914 RepID=UPI003C122DD0
MTRFQGKIILITGGTSGIGFATAQRLTEEGARVVLTGQNPGRINEARKALPDAVVIANDAADPQAAEALAVEIRGTVGELDGAFLNAGAGAFNTLQDVSAEDIDRQFALNVRGPILQAKALSPVMRDGGSFLLVGSGTVGSPRADVLVYASTKAAIRQIARSLASEFAPRKIRVNVVTPGLTETGFHDRAGMTADAKAAYKAAVAQAVPLKRLGHTADVAAVACFLLSDEAAYVTGADYAVNGGVNMA